MVAISFFVDQNFAVAQNPGRFSLIDLTRFDHVAMGFQLQERLRFHGWWHTSWSAPKGIMVPPPDTLEHTTTSTLGGLR